MTDFIIIEKEVPVVEFPMVFQFFGSKLGHTPENREDYYIGCVVGDCFKDEAFAARLTRVRARLDRKNFIHNSSCYRMGQKEMRRMDDETKYYRKKGMVDREYAKRKGELKATNLFAAELIKALDKDYQATMIELKKRYNQ